MTMMMRRFSLLGLSLILTTGLLVGCGGGETESTSTQTADKQVEKQSEEQHEHEEHAEAGHEEDHHEEEGHEHGHEHDRADHFQGKEAETYDEAVANMKEANKKLEDLLAKDELASEDFFQIHRMSYTMENALKVIREESDGDYADVKKNLESVHLASEKNDAETVRQDGQAYLEGARAMLGQK